MNKDIFYFKPIIESIFDMLGIIVSIWKKKTLNPYSLLMML